jgi:RNA polymerase sigma-70 factor (ECF subfamily)
MSDVRRFEAFVMAHQDMVFATAVRLVGRAADAEDIAQTVFLRAWERFDDLCDNPAAGGWLRTVATNLALNHLTRYRSRWRLFSEMSGSSSGQDAGAEARPFEESLASEHSQSADVERAGENARLEQALRGLPPHQRVPLVLFHFDEMSYDQIAERLRVSVGKVKTDIHRGRLALRTVLGGADGSR